MGRNESLRARARAKERDREKGMARTASKHGCVSELADVRVRFDEQRTYNCASEAMASAKPGADE